MKYLFDTHLLIWVADANLAGLLPRAVRDIVEDAANDVWFSAANIWEVVIKRALGRPDFQLDPTMLRLGALASGYQELPITAAHALRVADLASIHKDPFDRLLIAQARSEGAVLLTHDPVVAAYGANIQYV